MRHCFDINTLKNILKTFISTKMKPLVLTLTLWWVEYKI